MGMMAVCGESGVVKMRFPWFRQMRGGMMVEARLVMWWDGKGCAQASGEAV